MQADAAPLITHVWTVLYAVTYLRFGNTASGVAPELVQRTVCTNKHKILYSMNTLKLWFYIYIPCDLTLKIFAFYSHGVFM